MKYGPSAQTVTVEHAPCDGARAHRWVDDQGDGIPPRERERVWESFYRLDRHANSSVAGSGIGLYVVRELARLHGGDSVDRGQCDRRRAGRRRARRRPARAVAGAGCSTLDATTGQATRTDGRAGMTRVLVVEDNRNLATGLRNNLEIEGYEVDVAARRHDGSRARARGVAGPDRARPDAAGHGRLSRAEDTARGGNRHAGADPQRARRRDRQGARLPSRRRRLRREAVRPARAARARRCAAAPRGGQRGEERSSRRRSHSATSTSTPGRTRCVAAASPVLLRPKEYDLLIALLRRAARSRSRGELLEEVWGYSGEVYSRTVDTHVAELRRKLEDNAAEPRHILTVRKTGYRISIGVRMTTVRCRPSGRWRIVMRCESHLLLVHSSPRVARYRRSSRSTFSFAAGRVIDGTGSPERRADVGIRGDRITFVGNAATRARHRRARRSTRRGLIVAPGFIDPHTHTAGDLSNAQRKSNLPYLDAGRDDRHHEQRRWRVDRRSASCSTAGRRTASARTPPSTSARARCAAR